MKKVGRPPLYLYEDDRINTRREQNRNNQRNCRLKKKLHKQVRDITQPINFNKKYQEDIVNSFKNYGFNTLFTGTINLNHLEQDELEVMNKEVDKMNQELQIELNHFKERRTTIQSLKDYTERYIQFLYSRCRFLSMLTHHSCSC
jgi:histidinol dehydrogenase